MSFKSLRKEREAQLAKAQWIMEQAMQSAVGQAPKPIHECEVVSGSREFPKDLEVEWKNAPQSE